MQDGKTDSSQVDLTRYGKILQNNDDNTTKNIIILIVIVLDQTMYFSLCRGMLTVENEILGLIRFFWKVIFPILCVYVYIVCSIKQSTKGNYPRNNSVNNNRKLLYAFINDLINSHSIVSILRVI